MRLVVVVLPAVVGSMAVPVRELFDESDPMLFETGLRLSDELDVDPPGFIDWPDCDVILPLPPPAALPLYMGLKFIFMIMLFVKDPPGVVTFDDAESGGGGGGTGK